MQKQVAVLTSQLTSVQLSKEQYESKLKQAFMRGLSALNNETLPALSPSPTDHHIESKIDLELNEISTIQYQKLPLPLQQMLGEYSEYNTPTQTLKSNKNFKPQRTSKVEIKRGVNVVKFSK